MERETIAVILIAIGGLFAIVSGVYSITAEKALISTLTQGAFFGGVTGSLIRGMGIVGFIGGVISLIGVSRRERAVALLGGIIGLIAPCGLSLLAVIGALLLGEK